MIAGNQSCVLVTATRNRAPLPNFRLGSISTVTDNLIRRRTNTGDFAGGGATIPVGGVTGQLFCFDVPTTATFQGGAAYMRFRLSSAGGLDFDGNALDGEVEDYKLPLAKAGTLFGKTLMPTAFRTKQPPTASTALRFK